MGLLNNGYRHSSQGRIVGATNVDGANPYSQVYNTHRTAANRNLFASEAITDDLVAVPSGNRHPSAWIMARKPGAISSRYEAGITIGSTGAGSMGVNGSGTAEIIFGLTGTGGLISSATGSAGISLGLTGSLFASKAVAGSAGITIDASGTTTAIGHAGGSAGTALAATWTPYAIGWLSGTTAEAGLTPTGIANAVWAKVIEAGYSAEEIIRIMAASSAGSATGLEGANPQFTGLDGVTVRIDGTYSAGTRTIDSLDGS